MTCPSCGSAEAKGKFCSNCGAALSGSACRQCGTPLTPGARFCHVCATPVAGGRGGGGGGGVPSWLPWTVGGVIAGVLVIAAIFAGRTPAPPAPQQAAPQVASGVTDISQMSPEERALRLFDRVMRAQEAGDTTNVRFFAPMAIQAHEMIPQLNSDLRYHLGLIHLASGDPAAARVQADSILATDPTHLFGFMLRAEAARAQGAPAVARQADQAFLRNFDAESRSGRQEYTDHPGMIERYRSEAEGRN